jgi:hypothetical protein
MRSAALGAILILGSGVAYAIPPPDEIVVDRKNANALGFLVFLEPAQQKFMLRVVGPARIKGTCVAKGTSLELTDSRGNSTFSQEAAMGPPEEKVVVRGWFTPATHSLSIRLSYECPSTGTLNSTVYIFRSRDWERPGERSQ